MPATDRRFDIVGRALRTGLLLVAGLAWWGGAAHAFPPAPFHTIYGVARNEFGQPLEGADIKIFLETANGRVLQTGVGSVSMAGANYVIRVPMDTGMFDAPYHPTALRPLAPFQLKVMVGRTVLLPIEMRGDLAKLGQPGGKTRIDLTLGEDSDGDGLPDAWERVLLAMLGLDSLSAFDPNADADGDGLSNKQEYLAGTYASDPEDGFRLSIVEKTPEGPVLEFLAIRGRTYSLQSSANLQGWTTQPFKVVGTDTGVSSFRAADTRVLRIIGLVGADAAGFFNLKVE